tara:strand:+ start:285 stop:749 length:465 start_codon:yes stop_codon:yes gene_type:complete
MHNFILDVDGVLTTGQFLYSVNGKEYKIFGPDDNDALQLTKNYINVQFISADKRGFEISKKRIVDDMGFKLTLVSSKERKKWLSTNFDIKNIIFMADGIFDYEIMKEVGYSICPNNSNELTKMNSQYITSRNGGDRAVAEACLHILEKFFNKSF